jgi:hypothetical protein
MNLVHAAIEYGDARGIDPRDNEPTRFFKCMLLWLDFRGKLERGELLAQGFPNAGPVRLEDIPPEFWGRCSFADVHIVRDNQGHGYSQVRVLPMPKPGEAAPRDLGRLDYKLAVIAYRDYYKAQGKDPNDPDTTAPTQNEDLAVIEQLFGRVPDKILKDIRKKVWRNRIRCGRPTENR